MRPHQLFLGPAIALSLALPAAAQQGSPLQDIYLTNRSITSPARSASAAELQKASAAENPAVTSTAHNIYARLAAGNLNRSKLTAELSSALPDSTERTLSNRLGELGMPAWTFLESAQAGSGPVSIYELRYPTASAYLTFGVGANGVVYALFFTSEPPQLK